MSAPAIYHYDPDTGELLGVGEADLDPLATAKAGAPRYFGAPAHATLDPPPEPQAGHARCYRDGAWTQVEDHRGATVYDTLTGVAVAIEAPGPLPANVTDRSRPSELHKFEGGDWVEDAALKAEAEAGEAEAALFEIDRASIAQLRQVLIELGEGRALPADVLAALKASEAAAMPHRAKLETKRQG